MKKIIMSMAMIAAVGAVVVGATGAYFSDSEISADNTFTTGTINIDISDGEWSKGFELKDMKPSYTDYINFRIDNPGNNPVNVTKKLFDFDRDNGGVNEPECSAEHGNWNETNEKCENNTPNAKLDKFINYDLSVVVYDEDNQKLWWQTIYEDSDEETLFDVYRDEQKEVFLGMIPAGGYMTVEQSYHLQSKVGNWAQDDTLSFNIQIDGTQLQNTVTMVSKSGDDWDNIDQDEWQADKYAELTYKTKDKDFKYSLDVYGMGANTNYVVVSGTNPYDNSENDNVLIHEFTTDGSGNYSVADQVKDFDQDLENAKVWVVLKSDWNTWPNGVWSGDDYLYEIGLIHYYDTAQ